MPRSYYDTRHNKRMTEATHRETSEEIRRDLHRRVDAWFDRIVKGEAEAGNDMLKFLYYSSSRVTKDDGIMPTIRVTEKAYAMISSEVW